LSVTIYDIAEKAGFSIATVSRVFNDNPRVSDATRTSILSAAQELGYQPHASARSLARRQTETISAIIPMISNYFFAEVLKGLQDRMGKSPYDLLVFSAPDLEDVEGLLFKALHRGRSAGVLLFSAPMSEETVQRLQKSGQPVVLVDSFHKRFDSISTNNMVGGAMAADFILASGAIRPAVLAANPNSVPARDRLAGFKKRLAEERIELEEGNILYSKQQVFDGFNEQSGYDGMKELLSHEQRPDAVFATSDIQALGAMKALTEAGVDVPNDIQLIGFDDLSIARYVGLTTIRQPMHEIGAGAFDLLMARIEDRNTPVAHTIYAPSLIERQTTRTFELVL
jgi:LacI family transcriptional regulator